jgi:hypothetical protein
MATATKQKKTTEAESLAIALGLSSKTVTIRGESITVEEFEIEQLPQLLGLIKGLFEKAKGGDVTGALMMESGEVGIQLAMIATGKPRQWFKKMPLGDGLALYSAVIGANESFFAQMDQFTELIELVSGLFAPAKAVTSGQSSSRLSEEEVLRLIKSDE